MHMLFSPSDNENGYGNNQGRSQGNSNTGNQGNLNNQSYGNQGGSVGGNQGGFNSSSNANSNNPSNNNAGTNSNGQQRTGRGRGFASMDPQRVSEIASMGGKAAHAQGVAHEWTADEAREAGRKGGQASRGTRGPNEGETDNQTLTGGAE
jgi:general stress protein YciG